MKDEILRLRSEGKTYNEIVRLTGMSKGTIAYHCGEGQKKKYAARTKKRRVEFVARTKVERFRNRTRNFKRTLSGDNKNTTIVNVSEFYKAEDVAMKFFENPICYLSGRKINLDDERAYALDHIIPACKGGSNNLDNMGLTCKEANQAKADLSVSEFLSLCEDVLRHNGYKVEKL